MFSALSRGLDIKVIDIFSREGIVVDFMTVQKQRQLPPALSWRLVTSLSL